MSARRWSTIWGLVVVGYGVAALAAPRIDGTLARAGRLDPAALRLSIEHLVRKYGDAYPRGPSFLERLTKLEKAWHGIVDGIRKNDPEVRRGAKALLALQREALISANPLLDFDRLLLIRRGVSSPHLGLPTNWQGNCSLPRRGFDNEIASLSLAASESGLTTVHRPNETRFVGDLDLHFDGGRLLFSSIGTNGRWQVFEIRVDGSGLRQVTRSADNDTDTNDTDIDIDRFDACYLPSGRILFTSTASFQGVPCVSGVDHVANLFVMDSDGQDVRQLCFDQEHDWCPTVLNDGRVLYSRWEYSDLPHAFTRILMRMNPDGTGQAALYGSNSYWPNGVFYARPIPGDPGKVVGVVSGHHGVRRMGELLIFDPARGENEADGVVQRIPGRGKSVEPILKDQLVDGSWPRFLHPFPLSAEYFLVSCKPSPGSLWGLYLADVFDNLVLIMEMPGQALLEPIPLRRRPPPPVLPEKVRPDEAEGLVYIVDVYRGPGLAGIPRGTVKKLRLVTYHFAYRGMGGQNTRIGLDGPWDIKQVLGTVPVEEDGSALFRVPANMPISLQPLDPEGKALQLMRSWFTVMPGETLSCVGCHERQSTAPPSRPSLALRRPPATVAPWRGATRGFSFEREVQPVLDRYCVGCHDGGTPTDGRAIIDLRQRPRFDINPVAARGGSVFSPAYYELRRFVRSPTIESDLHLLTPTDFHADTTELVQLLQKGHHGVELDAEAWDRLITWIDLHAPYYGTWRELMGEKKVGSQRGRRRTTLKLYAGRDADPEAIPASAEFVARPVVSIRAPAPTVPREISVSGWPLGVAEARRRQTAQGRFTREVALGEGMALELVLIPGGEFVMGDEKGHADEQPTRSVRIAPFWLGRFEVSNEQYRRFDPSHDSRLEHGDFLHFSEEQRGFPLNTPRQPVARVSWHQAVSFCDWLSRKTGWRFRLPSEEEWEYACRAGTDTPLSYGGVGDDFSRYANLADATLKKARWPAIPPWRLANDRFNDGARVSAPIGSYQPNRWGLHDMHGNVAEWTASRYAPHFTAASGARSGDRTERRAGGEQRFGDPGAERRVVRGGSWHDRPGRSRSAFRLGYVPYQRVFNVGFRVACEVAERASRE